ncbi:MAG: hypothetical protein V2B18_15225, partial [Pseudomonadota bacterium]
HTQEEIAERVGCAQGEVSKSIPNGNSAEWNKNSKFTFTDWTEEKDIPLYNVWKQQNKSNGGSPGARG